MKYWIFNAEQFPTLPCDAADVWFEHNMGFSGNEWERYGEPLRKLEVGHTVLMYQNNKGFVGIGFVNAEWNEKQYQQKLIYKGADFPEYRVSIDWKFDLRNTPFSIGWASEHMLEIFRHSGRYNLNLRDVVGGAHGRPVIKMDSPVASAAIKQLVNGKAYFAVAITEENAGTDTKSMESRAEKDGDGFRLTGSKLWNARLRQATHVVLYTSSADSSSDDRSAFLLPIDHPGLEIIDRYAHGLTGNSFGGLEFENMYVGPEHLIGEDGSGGGIFDQHFLYWRLMQAAAAVGCGEQALEMMADRIRQRHVFGGPIGRFTHLQQPIGENLTRLRMAMALAREAARLYDRGDFDAAEPLVNGIKAEGVEIALEACDEAMRAHGALGYSREVDLGDRVRDLMGLRIADGTTDVMRMTVVREKYGFDLWEMSVRSSNGANEGEGK